MKQEVKEQIKAKVEAGVISKEVAAMVKVEVTETPAVEIIADIKPDDEMAVAPITQALETTQTSTVKAFVDSLTGAECKALIIEIFTKSYKTSQVKYFTTEFIDRLHSGISDETRVAAITTIKKILADNEFPEYAPKLNAVLEELGVVITVDATESVDNTETAVADAAVDTTDAITPATIDRAIQWTADNWEYEDRFWELKIGKYNIQVTKFRDTYEVRGSV